MMKRPSQIALTLLGCTLLIGSIYGISARVINQGFQRVEDDSVKNNVLRMKHAMNDQIARLDSVAAPCAGYTLMNDWNGRPALISRVSAPRGIYAQARQSLAALLVSMGGLGILGALLLLLAQGRLARDRRERKEEQTRFRSVFEGLGEDVILTDLRDVVSNVNAQMQEMSGYSASDMVGRPAYELLLRREAWPTLQARNGRRANLHRWRARRFGRSRRRVNRRRFERQCFLKHCRCKNNLGTHSGKTPENGAVRRLLFGGIAKVLSLVLASFFVGMEPHSHKK